MSVCCVYPSTSLTVTGSFRVLYVLIYSLSLPNSFTNLSPFPTHLILCPFIIIFNLSRPICSAQVFLHVWSSMECGQLAFSFLQQRRTVGSSVTRVRTSCHFEFHPGQWPGSGFHRSCTSCFTTAKFICEASQLCPETRFLPLALRLFLFRLVQ